MASFGQPKVRRGGSGNTYLLGLLFHSFVPHGEVVAPIGTFYMCARKGNQPPLTLSVPTHAGTSCLRFRTLSAVL